MRSDIGNSYFKGLFYFLYILGQLLTSVVEGFHFVLFLAALKSSDRFLWALWVFADSARNCFRDRPFCSTFLTKVLFACTSL